MKTIKQDDLYQNLNDFLKSKGVNLTEGAYSERIRKSCGLLTDVINATQKTVARAKTEVDKKLDQLRQSIHEATAPNPPSSASAPPPPPASETSPPSPSPSASPAPSSAAPPAPPVRGKKRPQQKAKAKARRPAPAQQPRTRRKR